jgi:hypothetical protein
VLKGATTAWASVVAVAALGVGAAVLSLSSSPSTAGTHHANLTGSDNHVSQPPAPHGWKVISYDGVNVDVPSEWPVVDGMHTDLCGGPFPDTPTAFVGPNLNSALSCPYIPSPARYGAWVYPSGSPDGGGPTINISDHKVAEVYPSYWSESRVEDLWYHGVEIEVGMGPDAHLVQQIVHSIGFKRGIPNTRSSGVCGTQAHPDAMPFPERLSRSPWRWIAKVGAKI